VIDAQTQQRYNSFVDRALTHLQLSPLNAAIDLVVRRLTSWRRPERIWKKWFEKAIWRLSNHCFSRRWTPVRHARSGSCL